MRLAPSFGLRILLLAVIVSPSPFLRAFQGFMTSRTAVAGVILVWLASLVFCIEYWTFGMPSGVVFLFGIPGVALILWAAYKIEDVSPIEIGLTALIPPLILLAPRGFKI